MRSDERHPTHHPFAAILLVNVAQLAVHRGMRHFLCAIALTLPTSLAAQSTCEMRDAPVMPVFEPAKAAFLSGDWDLFAELATPLIPDGP